MDWTDLEQFRGIDLHDSFILGWRHLERHVIFELEASIWPESEHYMLPKPGEYTCYRRATLAFQNIIECVGLPPMDSAPKCEDTSGEVDFGNFDSLKILSTGFECSGDFGTIYVKGGELSFEVHTQPVLSR
ncbi:MULTISPECIES: hypothetical protein [unclassified Halomonas]|uniref:hypothetical protein n=1 Tax=unclassified Halomonas TaxID=2609666 RepID=UPI0007D92297|nr:MULTISPECIES: hypothetical protein [unclassified Halomonas]MBT2788371.1 hypothetical protein [Halomonas sp. ISL-106]MBT2797962.1 hypothetical protein [Halomonas sp. ISL-104]OAL60535.1 hypothetical protein A6R74_17550 [Halomonas sp. ALS9]